MLDRSEAQDFLTKIATARVAGDVDALAQIFHEDAVFQVVGVGTPVVGREAIRAALDDLVARFEFIEWTLTRMLVDGDHVAVRHRLKVRHHPSGAVAETETSEFLAIEDGRCRAYTQFADTALVHTMSRAEGVTG